MGITLHFGRDAVSVPTIRGALDWARRRVRSERWVDTRPWDEILTEAAEVSAGTDYETLAAWDAAPDVYIGACFKVCHAPTILMKGSLRTFATFGVYICTTCEYAYAPGCAPAEMTREQLVAYAGGERDG